MAVYIRILPGLKVRVSKRGLRWSLGRARHACTSAREVPVSLPAPVGGRGTSRCGGAAEDHDEEVITMTTDPMVVRELDDILPPGDAADTIRCPARPPPLLPHGGGQGGPVAERGCH